MSVLIYVEYEEGKPHKSAGEIITYGRKLAQQRQQPVHVVCIVAEANEDTLQPLGDYGVEHVFIAHHPQCAQFDAMLFARALAQVALRCDASMVIMSQTVNGRAIAPVLSALLQAGLVTGALDLPYEEQGKFRVRKNVFGGKAIATVEVHTPKKIIAVASNALPAEKQSVTIRPEPVAIDLPVEATRATVLEVRKKQGKVALADAEIVVSAGRGLKGPENWGMIEELAQLLGAATACSRPVADVHWRPHEEHVGQTGLAIRPNLYIAIGISGAIQHLAGVSGSKVIVVINKDPEAPFFKAADYGIVGDAFEVVPRLNQALKRFKEGTLTFS